jgi:hypothetical protein
LSGRIAVAGALAQNLDYPGHTWVFLDWLVGLRRLGFEVLFIDQLAPGVDAIGAAAYLESAMDSFGLANSYSLLDGADGARAGIPREAAVRRLRESDLLLNFNGYLRDEAFLDAADVRVYVDIDPGFGQMWRELGLHDPFAGHDLFVTLAENIDHPNCTVPTCGLDWITTRQPVVLELWPVRGGEPAAFTSIGGWRGPFAPVEFNGKRYGLRAHEFRKFAELPQLTGERFELALDIHEAELPDLDLLQRTGWRLVEPRRVAGTPSQYREYIGRSKAELMVAKQMYVETQGGWFSDRSACYLASGRPVVAQDTGIRELYPTGHGLVAFSTLGEAVDAVESVGRDYKRHARAAREIAESEFDSDVVLGALLDRLSALVR